jgi:hypothetical protein
MGGILGNEAWRRSNGGLWLPRVFGMPETVYGWCPCGGEPPEPPDTRMYCCPIVWQEWPEQLQIDLSEVLLKNYDGMPCDTCADIPSHYVLDRAPQCDVQYSGALAQIAWWYIEEDVCTGRRVISGYPSYNFPLDLLVLLAAVCIFNEDDNYKPAIRLRLSFLLMTNEYPANYCVPPWPFCINYGTEDKNAWYHYLMDLQWEGTFPVGRNSNGVYDSDNPFYRNCYLDITDPDSLPTYWREDHPEIPLGCFPMSFSPGSGTPNIGQEDGRLACQYVPYGTEYSCDGTGAQPDPILVCEV